MATSTTIDKIKSFNPNIEDGIKSRIQEEKRTRTGPGAFGAYMERESEVFRENEKLKSELGLVKDGMMVVSLDPKKIKPSHWANRIEANFRSSEFANFKSEILQENGNVQPIKVRPIAASEDEFEIIYGHRRHRACLELGIQVKAIISRDTSDQKLFFEMEYENRHRKNISAYEQGLFYKRAIDERLFESQSDLSRVLNVERATVVRSIELASMPEVVIQAFSDPTEIQYRWIKMLKDALSNNRSAVLKKANEIKNELIKSASATVLKELIEASEKRSNKSNSMTTKWKFDENKNRLTMTIDGINGKNDPILKKVESMLEALKNPATMDGVIAAQ